MRYKKPKSKFFKNNKAKKPVAPKPNPTIEELNKKGIRLNKYVSNAGVCSRRKADELIANGEVTVNGEVVLAMGHKVQAGDVVMYDNKKIVPNNKIYLLLNKPKNIITTTHDPQGRKTVIDIVKSVTTDRLYPVGRLDRNTTGLLILTNDGELSQRLAHPRYMIPKLYHAVLDKPLTKRDLGKIRAGLTLEDGPVEVDEVAYVKTATTKKEVGISLHLGRNRIVRRIFQHLGYEVLKLDRVMYADLTKKDLPRGKWRNLTDKELVYLKHFNAKNLNR